MTRRRALRPALLILCFAGMTSAAFAARQKSIPQIPPNCGYETEDWASEPGLIVIRANCQILDEQDPNPFGRKSTEAPPSGGIREGAYASASDKSRETESYRAREITPHLAWRALLRRLRPQFTE